MRRQDLAALALLIALVALFFWRLWAPNPADRLAFPEGDFTHQYWPLRRFVARELAAGRLPLWNPYIWGGQPGLADPQAAALYPPAVVNALWWGADFPLVALELEVVAHVMWAGVGAYLLARRLMRGTTALAPWTSGVAFALSGYLTGFPLQQVSIAETVAWLPWWLWALHRTVQVDGTTRRLANGVLAGVLLALAVLAGHPQVVLYQVYLGGAWLLWLLFRRARGRRAVDFLVAPVPFLVGAGLSAAQWMPTLDFIARSERATLNYAFVSTGLPWDELVTAVLPNFFGGTPLYVGPVVLGLAALGLLAPKRRPEKWFWAAVAVAGLLLALGGRGGLFQLLYLGLPGWDRVRDQERVLVVVALAFALLAGWGVEGLARGSRDAARRVQRATAWALLPTTFLVGAFYVARAQILGGMRQGYAEVMEGFLGNALMLLVLLVLLLAALALARRWPRVGSALAAALVAYNLFVVNQPYHQGDRPPDAFFPPDPLVTAAQQAAQEGRVHDPNVLQPAANAGMVYAVETLSGNEPLRLAHTARFLEGVPSWFQWELLAVQHVLSEQPLDPTLFTPVAGREGAALYRLKQPRPRAWLVAEVQQVPSAEVAWERLEDEDFDVYRTALVERAPPPVTGTGQVTLVRRTPGYVALRVEADAAVFLVVSEVADPGWQVWIDGARGQWLRAYGLLVGVPLPGGAHDVELKYAPPNWRLARALSLGTGVLCLLVWAVAILRSRPGSSGKEFGDFVGGKAG